MIWIEDRSTGQRMAAAVCVYCRKVVRCPPSAAVRKKYCSVACKTAAPSGLMTHGESRTPLYGVWSSMKSRCGDSSRKNYAWYGARGITVCSEWASSFVAFRDWAIRAGYKPGLELDRIDVDKGYSPDNCRWATRTQQMRNCRKRQDAKTSQYKGVSWHSQNHNWRAQITDGRRNFSIGSYATEIEAARAYDAEARKRFGEHAHTNFKEG